MNIYEVSRLIHELKQEKQTPYNLKLIKFYEGKKQELIKEINKQIKSFEFGNKSFEL